MLEPLFFTTSFFLFLFKVDGQLLQTLLGSEIGLSVILVFSFESFNKCFFIFIIGAAFGVLPTIRALLEYFRSVASSLKRFMFFALMIL